MLDNLEESEAVQESEDADILSFVEQKDVEKVHLRDVSNKYVSEISSKKRLTMKEEEELSYKILQNGDQEAREILITHNLHLVPWVAKRFRWSALPYEDLIQEGNLGLMTAVEKFDARIGRFSTYAPWWISASIRCAIMNQSKMIRVPVNVQVLQNKIEVVRKELIGKGSPRPSLHFIAKQIGVPEEDVKDALWSQLRYVSLDGSFKDEKNEDIIENDLPCERVLLPESLVEAHQQLARFCDSLELICGAISSLPNVSERNLSIFRNYYGLNESAETMTLEEVGQLHGVSKERIRKIIEVIWIKMQKNRFVITKDDIMEQLWHIRELEKITGTLVRFKV